MKLNRFSKLVIPAIFLALLAAPVLALTNPFSNLSSKYIIFNSTFWYIAIPVFVFFLVGWYFYFRSDEGEKKAAATLGKYIVLGLIGIITLFFASFFSSGGNFGTGLYIGWAGFLLMAFMGTISKHAIAEQGKNGRGTLIYELALAITLSGILAGPYGLLRVLAKDPLAILKVGATSNVQIVQFLGAAGAWAIVGLVGGIFVSVFMKKKGILDSESEKEEKNRVKEEQKEREKREDGLKTENQQTKNLEAELQKKQAEVDAKTKELDAVKRDAEQGINVLRTNPAPDLLNNLLRSLSANIPAYNNPLQPVTQMIDTHRVENELNKEIATKQRVISLIKDNFAASKPGKRAQYLLQLKDKLSRNPEAWRGYVGDNFNNFDLLGGTVQAETNDAGLAIALALKSKDLHVPILDVKTFMKLVLEPELRKLIKQRTTLIKANTNDLNYLIKEKQTILQGYQGHDVSLLKTSQFVNSLNQKLDQENRTLQEMRGSLQQIVNLLKSGKPGDAAAMIQNNLIPKADEAKRIVQEEKGVAAQGMTAAVEAANATSNLIIFEEAAKKAMKGWDSEGGISPPGYNPEAEYAGLMRRAA